jgi:hypothetical protein
MRTWIVACAAAALLGASSARAASPAPEEMAQRIAGSLRESGELTDYRVGVKYEDGVAWLMGSVTSDEQSATAERLAREVEGVSHVVNKLAVKPQTAPQVKEATKASSKDAGLLLATLQEEPSAPAELPPMASAMPTPKAQCLPRPMQRLAMAPQGQGGYAPQGNVSPAQYGECGPGGMGGGSMPMPQGYSTAGGAGVGYDNANMPSYAWPSYAAHPNYAALSYPQQYSPSAWPYIGPFYPYPQVPLGWRKVTLEWDDGWWFLDFSHHKGH